MKFVCDSCRAQYMISDDKVGPAGVKVRCKRCGNIILVRRDGEGEAPASEATPPPAAAPEPPPRQGIEDEIGAALDSAFAPRAPTAESAVESAPEAPAAAPSGEPGRFDWYVAVDEKQVGPLGFEELKSRFEASSIGPDTLAWRVGLADWRPLSQIPELASHLSPRASRPTTRAETPAPVRAAREKAAAEAPASDGGWKPTAGSALASLVEQEMQAAKKPEPDKAKPAPVPETTNVRNLLGALPEPPPPEPSRLIPVSERSAARPMPDRSRTRTGFWGSPSRGGLGRVAVLSAVIAVVVLVGGLAGLWALGVVRLPGGSSAHPAPAPHPAIAVADPQAAAPAPAAPTVPPAPTPAAAAPAPVAAAAAPGSAAAPAPAAAPPPAAAEAAAPPVAKPAEAKATEALAATEIKKPERASSDDEGKGRHGRKSKHEREVKTASAHERAPAGGESAVDAAFEKELSGGGGGTYIPPAPGAPPKASKLAQGDIMAVVVAQKGSIKTCVQKYKESGGGTGKLVMSWMVQPSGKTGSIHPKGPEHAALASCLTKLIQTWKFPDYAGPATPIEFPFTF